MSEKKRKILTGAQKAKIALEAVKEQKTVNEIAQEYGKRLNLDVIYCSFLSCQTSSIFTV